ncbi:phosphotransferase [Collinsella tanakaei]|nr:phosphotransferase [Collinsella tanakaei]
MEGVQTTGGLFTEESRRSITDNICRVFGCGADDIENLEPVQEGMTNIVLSFRLNGGRYVYRHPGLGSDELVDRGRETIMQKVVEEAGIDTTLVAMDVDEGWRIGRFVEHRDFDYHDLNDMVRAMMLLRRLHAAPARVRWEFDVVKKAEGIRDRIPPEDYGNFPEFESIRERIYCLNGLAARDGIKKCNIHGDARDVNFLVNDEEIYLIDWEYGGYGDPGFDIGSYVGGGDHSVEDVERILFTYYRRKPTPVQRRHFYAYIAISGWFYLHWTMLKESKGQAVGRNKDLWYRYARDWSLMALDMYGCREEGDDR